jgi:hypothetical protein
MLSGQHSDAHRYRALPHNPDPCTFHNGAHHAFMALPPYPRFRKGEVDDNGDSMAVFVR